MNVIWQPNPGPQTEALSRSEFEILYGGARGGGKTDALIAWEAEPFQIPQYRGLVIRQNAVDLGDYIDRAAAMYYPLGGKRISSRFGVEFQFESGAKIRTGHLKDESAYTKYQGHEYQRVGLEELTQIPSEESYLKLISSCRSTVDNLKPQVFNTANPGGPGHLWVKSRFVDIGPPGKPVGFTDAETGLTRYRIFIPAKVEDNPVLMQKDPTYVAWLNSLPEDLRKAWREGSWDVYEVKGAYYAHDIARARGEGRICPLPHEPHLLTDTWWDLGLDDQMVIGFKQSKGLQIRMIDLEVFDGRGFDFAVPLLHSKGFKYGTHIFPHDMANKEFNGRTRIETFIQFYIEHFGVRPNCKIVPRGKPEDGIQAVRVLLPRMWFDETRFAYGIQAMTQYRKEWDEIKQTYRNIPYHDWTSHVADMMRTGAEGMSDVKELLKPPPRPKPSMGGGWRSQVGMG